MFFSTFLLFHWHTFAVRTIRPTSGDGGHLIMQRLMHHVKKIRERHRVMYVDGGSFDLLDRGSAPRARSASSAAAFFHHLRSLLRTAFEQI